MIMKKFLMLPLLAVMALMASCSGDDDKGGFTPPAPSVNVTSVDYYGIASVADISVPVRCTVLYNNAAALCEIKVTGLKFSDAMPAVNVRLAGILCSASASEIEFAMSTPVIPEVAMGTTEGSLSTPGVSSPQFAMNNLTGVIKDKTMEVTATMALGEFSFKGTVVPIFSGVMKVLANGSQQVFAVQNTNCEIETSLDGSSANIFIYGAKFAAEMPTTVDIKLADIPCRQYDGGYTFSVNDSIVPLVRMVGEYVPMEAFTFSKINGEVLDEGAILFNATMTRGVFEYEGERFIKTAN